MDLSTWENWHLIKADVYKTILDQAEKNLNETIKISVYIGNYGVETIQPDGKRNPMIAMLTAILAEFATLERETLIDRTRSGLAPCKT